jgi:hypothetical protein
MSIVIPNYVTCYMPLQRICISIQACINRDNKDGANYIQLPYISNVLVDVMQSMPKCYVLHQWTMQLMEMTIYPK